MFPLGNVLRNSDHSDQFSVPIVNMKGPVVNPLLQPVGSPNAELRVAGFSPRFSRLKRLGSPVLGMNRFIPCHRTLIEAGAAPAPSRFKCRADIDHFASRRRYDPKNFLNVLRQLAKVLFAAPQGVLGLFAVRDILGGAGEPEEVTILRKVRLRVRFGPAPLAIGTKETYLAPERRMLL